MNNEHMKMQKNIIHPKSSEKMKTAINELISITRIENRIPRLDFVPKYFEDIATELNKRKEKTKINSFQCMITYFHKVSYFYTYILEKDIDYSTDEVPPKERDELIEFIYNAFFNCPSSYTITFRFRDLLLPEHDLNKNIKIRTVKSHQLALGLFGNSQKNESDVEFYGTGLYTPYTKSDFLKEYLHDLNTFLYFITEHGLVISKEKTDDQREFALGLYAEHDRHLIKKYTATIMDDNYPKELFTEPLPLSISKYISSLEIKPNKNKNPGVIINVISNTINHLIEDQSSEAKRIRMAIGWYMNSSYNEDDTMAFLQICMGLEAIFGDDQDQGGLTKMLADRCAYLIGKNINQRRKIRDSFGKIYTIRSKIVHGVINRLSDDDKFMRNYAKGLLQAALKKEIVNLEY